MASQEGRITREKTGLYRGKETDQGKRRNKQTNRGQLSKRKLTDEGIHLLNVIVIAFNDRYLIDATIK